MAHMSEDPGDLAWQGSSGFIANKTDGGSDSSKSVSPHEKKAPLSESYEKYQQHHDRGKRKEKRSDSRSRSRSPVKSHHSQKSRRRSRSRDRSRRSRSKERRRSSRERRTKRSRSRDRRSHSRDRGSKRKERSRSREPRRSRERSRERRRSKERKESRPSGSPKRQGHRLPEERKSRSKSPFRPKMPSKAALKFIAQQSKESIAAKLAEVTQNVAIQSEKPSNLPLNLLGTTAMTPQLVLQQTMAAMSAQAQSLTGVALPKYYNPAAVNPLKYAEQMQKRKLLWKNKEKPEVQPKSNSIWAQTHFNQDQDGKMSAKFRKLMGLKEDEAEGDDNKPSSSGAKPESTTGTEVIQKQEALFRDLDNQYETARMVTHTQRGMGLGYSAQPQTLIYPK